MVRLLRAAVASRLRVIGEDDFVELLQAPHILPPDAELSLRDCKELFRELGLALDEQQIDFAVSRCALPAIRVLAATAS